MERDGSWRSMGDSSGIDDLLDAAGYRAITE